MTQLVTAREMQLLDDYTQTTIGLPHPVLVERAALAVLEVIGAGHFDVSNVLILAGLGHNGADGIAVARLLHQQGITVTLQFVGNSHRAKPAVKEQLAIAEQCGVRRAEKSDFHQASLIIDAIFGTGLTQALPEGLQKMIKAANHIEKPVIAIDVPTGIDATTGDVRGAALKSHTTVTLGYLKAGLTKKTGAHLSGNVIVKPVGIMAPPNFRFSLK